MALDKHQTARRKAPTPRFLTKAGIPEQTQTLWDKILRAVDDLTAHTQQVREETIHFIQKGAHTAESQGTDRVRHSEAQAPPSLSQHSHLYHGIHHAQSLSQKGGSESSRILETLVAKLHRMVVDHEEAAEAVSLEAGRLSQSQLDRLQAALDEQRDYLLADWLRLLVLHTSNPTASAAVDEGVWKKPPIPGPTTLPAAGKWRASSHAAPTEPSVRRTPRVEEGSPRMVPPASAAPQDPAEPRSQENSTPQLLRFMARVQSGATRPDSSDIRAKLVRGRSGAITGMGTGPRRPAHSAAWQTAALFTASLLRKEAEQGLYRGCSGYSSGTDSSLCSDLSSGDSSSSSTTRTVKSAPRDPCTPPTDPFHTSYAGAHLLLGDHMDGHMGATFRLNRIARVKSRGPKPRPGAPLRHAATNIADALLQLQSSDDGMIPPQSPRDRPSQAPTAGQAQRDMSSGAGLGLSRGRAKLPRGLNAGQFASPLPQDGSASMATPSSNLLGESQLARSPHSGRNGNLHGELGGLEAQAVARGPPALLGYRRQSP
eukprot:jgi/Botrbrau1/5937/Bobra.0366s0110.2